MSDANRLDACLEETMGQIAAAVDHHQAGPAHQEVGRVLSAAQGILWVDGLSRITSEELVVLADGAIGLALDILPEKTGIVMLDRADELRAGSEVRRTGRTLEVPVAITLLGRIIDPLGRPLDNRGTIAADERWPVQREAPAIKDRSPVSRPLQTGIKVIDALIPIGRGQRELILGDRQTGKTAVAIDTIINQQGADMVCIYCAIGQRGASVARVVAELKRHEALAYTIVMVAEGSDPPGLQFIAPYAATTMAEFFATMGRDVLVVYDDLTQHASSYRQISLLLRRPPGREAFPGDIFYIHSRLLERATALRPEKGGGTITALPVIETEAQNISAYIPTNLISITDGQIYLSPDLGQKGVLPAIDVGKSVSRVGGKAQLPGYRRVAGDLRLSYSQFQELEAFSRFGTRLDASTKNALTHGRRVREALKQKQYAPLSAGGQIAVLRAVTQGLFDAIPLAQVNDAEEAVLAALAANAGLAEAIAGSGNDDPAWEQLDTLLAASLAPFGVTGDQEGEN